MKNATEIAGTTVHIARGAKYAGAFEVAEATEAGDGWIAIRFRPAGMDIEARCEWFTRPEDTFATEAEARECARSRRQPRRRRPALYGDFGWLAAFSGIRTDGSGISNVKATRRAQ